MYQERQIDNKQERTDSFQAQTEDEAGGSIRKQEALLMQRNRASTMSVEIV